MVVSFDQLDTEAAEIPYGDPVREGVNRIIAHAADNAQTSDASEMGSVEDLLAYTDDQAVVAWFTSRGVRF